MTRRFSLTLLASLFALSAPLEARADEELAGAAEPPSEEDEEAKDPMAWFGIGVKLGVGRVHSSSLNNPTYNATAAAYAVDFPQTVRDQYGLDTPGACTFIDLRCETEGRFGLLVSVPIQLGGDGFGWDIEPYFADSPSIDAFGVYTGPKFDIHLADPFYLGFGLGFKAARLFADSWDYGADLYGRIPLRGTLYVSEDFALVLEFAFGAGWSGYASNPVQIYDPVTQQTFTTTPSMTFGSSRTWDFSAGVRFP